MKTKRNLYISSVFVVALVVVFSAFENTGKYPLDPGDRHATATAGAYPVTTPRPTWNPYPVELGSVETPTATPTETPKPKPTKKATHPPKLHPTKKPPKPPKP